MKSSLFGNLAIKRSSRSRTPLLCSCHHSRLGLSTLFGLTFTLLTHSTHAQTWQTVDDFQYVPGQAAESDGLALAPNGTLFASGSGADSSGVRHGLVMASANVGTTWSGLLDDFVYPGTHTTLYNAGMVADSAGNLYVAGTAYDDGTPSGGPNHWIVRRSTDNGATWSTVDDFAPGGFLTQPNGIGADAAGNIYVAGDADYVNPYDTTYWTIRKGVGGTNFTTVDSISSGSSGNTAMAVFAHPTAGLFAVGRLRSLSLGSNFSAEALWNGLSGGALTAAPPGPLLTPLLFRAVRACTDPRPMASARTPSATFTSLDRLALRTNLMEAATSTG